jgi:hypothetical protein
MRYPDIPLFEHLKAECAGYSAKMVTQITALLRGPIKLPLLIRVIGHLGRVQEMTQAQLATCLLQQRDVFISQQLHLIKAPDANEYCRRYIDTFSILFNLGEHFFDITTHFKAIFMDHALQRSILASFCNRKIQQFIQVLEEKLSDPSIEMTHIVSIMNQTMYFGMSVGRVGLDFRFLVAPIFETQILRRMHQSFSSALQAYQHARSHQKQVLDENTPLVDNVPLAQLYNRYLTALNQLRVCAPLSLQEPLEKLLHEHLQQIPKHAVLERDLKSAFASIYAS